MILEHIKSRSGLDVAKRIKALIPESETQLHARLDKVIESGCEDWFWLSVFMFENMLNKLPLRSRSPQWKKDVYKEYYGTVPTLTVESFVRPRFFVVDNEIDGGVEHNGVTGRYVVIDRVTADAWHFPKEDMAINVAFALNFPKR